MVSARRTVQFHFRSARMAYKAGPCESRGMSIETVRGHEQSSRPDGAVIDVSEVDAERVRAYARESAAEGHPEIYLERKGGRTYLVAE